MKMATAAAAPLLLLLALATGVTAAAVTFEATNTVPNSAGGQRFDQEVGGVDYAAQVLSEASSFIWTMFNESNPEDRRDYDSVTLTVVDNLGQPVLQPVAQTIGNTIQLRAQYVAGFNGDVKREVTGVLYHETTHVWQLPFYAQKPGLFEGMADYVRLKAGLAPGNWVQPGQGDRWDQGYEVTAFFLDYLDSRESAKEHMCEEMKNAMEEIGGYSDDIFVQIFGKSVDELWSDYKAKYSQGYHNLY